MRSSQHFMDWWASTISDTLNSRSLALSSRARRSRANFCAFQSWETYQNYSVPPSAFSNGKGSYSIPSLSLSTGTSFLLTMSDATGFGSGGTTDVLFVGNPIANNNCNTTVLSTPYMWQLSPLPLLQCSQFTVATDSGAVPPITIVQLIPAGQPVVFNSNSYTFTSAVDVNTGTNLLYFVTDSEGRQGGISGFEQVSGSSNSSCLSANSPSTTAGISATATSTSTTTGSLTSTTPTSRSSSSNVALIAGAAGGGGGGVLIALVILGVCLWRKRRASHSPDVQSSITSYPQGNFVTTPVYGDARSSTISSAYNRMSQPMSPNYPLQYPVGYPPPIQSGSQSSPLNTSTGNFTRPNADFAVYGDARISDMTPVEHMAAGARPASPLPQKTNPVYLTPPTQDFHQSPDTDSLVVHGASGSQSIGSASAQTAYQPPIRIIVHTDANDVMPGDNGLIELPPQYSDHWGARAS
ncbi:uncharacterized protein BJ212DRAFT_1368928 [Suillus subaureus]|uniref:Uncharacterized protein n=1 Tax=Suillus subaureus TaxID=48587 RepID=A0A9P7E775_9AGAM|nr:uncharacterized protein BJ212DRAFT_1368928 [Suillus subaureus]KAG1812911.1 hypothetical protein BJ212DRAFT_1368928 [Suillus subaureus]